MPQKPPLPDRRRFLQALGATGLVYQGSLPALLALACRGKERDSASDTGSNTDDRFYFAVLSDLHIQADPKHANCQTLAETGVILGSLEYPIEFVLACGDLVDNLPSDDPAWYTEHKDTSLHQLKSLLAGFPMPVYPVPGNHDYYTASGLNTIHSTDDLVREGILLEHLSLPGIWYRFDHQGVAFYALNSMQQDGRVSWRPGSCGSFGEKQLAWLESQLADGVPAVLYFHHPLALDNAVEAGVVGFSPFEVPRAEGNYEKYEGSVYEGWTDPIYAILQAHAEQVLAVFVGHGHWFVHDEYQGFPVMEPDSIGNSVRFTEYQDQPMRFYVVEVNLTQGTLTVVNQDWFTWNL